MRVPRVGCSAFAPKRRDSHGESCPHRLGQKGMETGERARLDSVPPHVRSRRPAAGRAWSFGVRGIVPGPPHLTLRRVPSLQYKVGERAPLWVNKVGPYHNPQETYEYFKLPYCQVGLPALPLGRPPHPSALRTVGESSPHAGPPAIPRPFPPSRSSGSRRRRSVSVSQRSSRATT